MLRSLRPDSEVRRGWKTCTWLTTCVGGYVKKQSKFWENLVGVFVHSFLEPYTNYYEVTVVGHPRSSESRLLLF